MLASLKTIAGKLGIHPRTLLRWRRHDLDFRRTLVLASQKALTSEKGVRNLLPERPGECFAQKVPDTFFTPIEQLRQLVPKAVEIVHSEMDNENFQAAIAVLRLVHNHLETYEHLAS